MNSSLDQQTSNLVSPNIPAAEYGQPIGLIGIGLMGSVLAERLMTAGYKVLGWDLNPDRQIEFSNRGGRLAAEANLIFADCRRIVLSLPSHEAVAQVLEGARPSLRKGLTIIDTSTGDPVAATHQSEWLLSQGIEYIDATVSGSSEQLRTGDAVILAGASASAFEDCRNLFACLVKKIFHTGPPGSGARMKLVTNLVLGLNRAALAEGLCFAQQLGLDLQQSLRLLRESMSYSRIMDTKGEKMLRHDFSPQARLSQHLKDVRLMLSAVETTGYLPLTETHRMLLERAEEMGLGQLDNSAILEVIAAGRAEAKDQ